jgi:hypothetical protein
LRKSAWKTARRERTLFFPSAARILKQAMRKTKFICTLGPSADKTETRPRRFGIANVLAD